MHFDPRIGPKSNFTQMWSLAKQSHKKAITRQLQFV
jgi:hypothetical protein